jgi:hypothetical protein
MRVIFAVVFVITFSVGVFIAVSAQRDATMNLAMFFLLVSSLFLIATVLSDNIVVAQRKLEGAIREITAAAATQRPATRVPTTDSVPQVGETPVDAAPLCSMPSNQSQEPRETTEIAAQRLLEKARMLVKLNAKSQAVDVLKEVIHKYPRSSAAARALGIVDRYGLEQKPKTV